GGTFITIVGKNFGPSSVSFTVTVGVGTAPVGTFNHLNDTHVICQTPPGDAANQQILFSGWTTPGHEGVFTINFIYDSPIAYSVFPQNGLTAGGSIITVLGDNFGFACVGGCISSAVLAVKVGTYDCNVQSVPPSNHSFVACSVTAMTNPFSTNLPVTVRRAG